MSASGNVGTEDPSRVVWLLDPRYRPELEVEIEIVYQAGELPGLHYASARPELEVEVEVELADPIVDLTRHCLIDDDFIVVIQPPPISHATYL